MNTHYNHLMKWHFSLNGPLNTTLTGLNLCWQTFFLPTRCTQQRHNLLEPEPPQNNTAPSTLVWPETKREIVDYRDDKVYATSYDQQSIYGKTSKEGVGGGGPKPLKEQCYQHFIIKKNEHQQKTHCSNQDNGNLLGGADGQRRRSVCFGGGDLTMRKAE